MVPEVIPLFVIDMFIFYKVFTCFVIGGSQMILVFKFDFIFESVSLVVFIGMGKVLILFSTFQFVTSRNRFPGTIVTSISQSSNL